MIQEKEEMTQGEEEVAQDEACVLSPFMHNEIVAPNNKINVVDPRINCLTENDRKRFLSCNYSFMRKRKTVYVL